MSKKESIRKEESKEGRKGGRKLSKQTSSLYIAKINTWITAHYWPGARTGQG